MTDLRPEDFDIDWEVARDEMKAEHASTTKVEVAT